MKVKPRQDSLTTLPQINRDSKSCNSSLGSFCSKPYTLILGISLLFLIYYVYHFINSLPLWFHPGWTTDDALQQWFPFHEILDPGVFNKELMYEVMKGYLAPLHYWICAIATYLTGDVIMAAHWVMLIQVSLTALFTFLAVRVVAGNVPAIFSLIWLLHTRQIIQRMTAGLPRGWSGVVIPAFFYFAFKRNHTGVLVVLLLGCLSHPPTTMICALTYGLWLLKEVAFGEREAFLKPLIILVLLSPVYAFITWKVVERPDHVGQMVSYGEAIEMPQFRYPHGRFPFLPHPKVSTEWWMYGFQAFTGRFYKPVKVLRKHIRTIVVVMFVFLLFFAYRRKKVLPPSVLFIFLFSIVTVYFLSRPLAFKLYVPNRHLQFPMAYFWILSVPILIWAALHRGGGVSELRSSLWKNAKYSFLGMILLSGFVYAGSSTGLIGSANFNYSTTKKGNFFIWARKNTPKHALFAGHPKLIDGLMLFGQRRAYATNETYHPFYKGYLAEMERRLEKTFRAHYAKELGEIPEIFKGEDVDYFVFDRKKFYPDLLKAEKFYPPLDALVEDLTADDPSVYAYKKIPRELNLEIAPYLVYRDDHSVVIDIEKLRQFLS